MLLHRCQVFLPFSFSAVAAAVAAAYLVLLCNLLLLLLLLLLLFNNNTVVVAAAVGPAAATANNLLFYRGKLYFFSFVFVAAKGQIEHQLTLHPWIINSTKIFWM